MESQSVVWLQVNKSYSQKDDVVAVPKGYKINDKGVPYKKKKGDILFLPLKAIMLEPPTILKLLSQVC